MSIGDRIRHYRIRTGITQAELAELAGVHPVSVRKYETNKMIPQLPQLEKIAKAMGVRTYDLLEQADMMDAVTAVRIIGEICDTYKGICKDCPLYDLNHDCKKSLKNSPETVISMLHEWRGKNNGIK